MADLVRHAVFETSRRAAARRRAFAFLLVLLTVGALSPSGAGARTSRAHLRAQLPDSAVAESLRVRVARLRALSGLPDSVRRRAVDDAIKELGGAIENLSQELSNLDVQVEDQAISLRDRTGGGRVRINIPPDLGTRISQGISSITATILSELPDTLVLHAGGHGYSGRLGGAPTPQGPPGPRQAPAPPNPHFTPPLVVFEAPPVPPAAPEPRIVGGDVVRVFGDIAVSAEEEISGDVIAVFGAVNIKGQVDGRVISVFGTVELARGARVGRDIVAVLGGLKRDKGAEIGGSVFALGSGRSVPAGGVRRLLWSGWLAFAGKVILLIATALLLVLLFALLPRDRLDAALSTLTAAPRDCLGRGLVWLAAGHLLLTFLMAVLVLTLIGIPLAFLLGVGYLALMLLALGVASHPVGLRLAAAHPAVRQRRIATVLLGLIALNVPDLLGGLAGLASGLRPLAAALVLAGLAVKLIAISYGLGAILASRFGRRAVPARPLASPAAA